MAKRIHVFALRNAPPEVVRAALAPLGQIEVSAANGWCWFCTSVWGLGAEKILEPFADFDGPLLFITTEDACRWYLRLRAKGQEPYLTVHEIPASSKDENARDFEDFDTFDEDDEEQFGGEMVVTIGSPPFPRTDLTPLESRDPFFEPYVEYDEDFDDDDDDVDDDEDIGRKIKPLEALCAAYEESGIPLSDSLVAELRDLPEDTLHDAFRELHAVEILEALERFNIPYDRQTVLDTLTGQSVTPVESDWDIGNLPRFLSALGFGPYFDDMVAEAEQEFRESLARKPENHSAAILKKMGGVTTVPLADGPLRLALEDSPLLFLAGYYTHEGAKAAFTAELPAGESFSPATRVPSYISIHERNGRLEIGALDNDVFLAPTACKKLGKTLADLPAGTALTLHLSGPKALRQQFRGTIEGGQWLIESTTVPLAAATLLDALSLFRAGHAKVPLLARDEAEVEAILDAVKTDFTLHDMPPARDGLALMAPRCNCKALATLFFRHRFGHVWDCSKAIAENEAKLANWRQINEDMAAAERLPVTEKVVLEGRAATFYEADLKADCLDELMVREIEKLPSLVEAQVALGLEYLGSLVCGKLGRCILCGFADVGAHAYAVHYIMPFGMTWKDCFTPCKDGTSLTTTNGYMGEGSIPQLRILEHRSEAQDFSGLLADHRKGRDLLKQNGIETTPVEPTLEGLAGAIDDFLVKRMANQ